MDHQCAPIISRVDNEVKIRLMLYIQHLLTLKKAALQSYDLILLSMLVIVVFFYIPWLIYTLRLTTIPTELYMFALADRKVFLHPAMLLNWKMIEMFPLTLHVVLPLIGDTLSDWMKVSQVIHL